MRKLPQEEVAAAARRRLELLGRELEQAGLTRLDQVGRYDDADRHEEAAATRERPEPGSHDDLLPPAVVRPVGRHAGPRRLGRRERLRASLGGLVPPTMRGTVSLDRGALVVVMVLAVLGVGAAAVAVGREAGSGRPAAPAADAPSSAAPLVSAGAGPTAGAPSGTPSGAASAAPADGVVVVHVAGKVRRPGVVELAAGSRVADAVRRAGGPKRGVGLDGLNLARVLVDGEQLVVGGEAPVASGPAASAAATATPATGGLVSLNAATLDQLDTLPGVGPVTAQKILDWRTSHGAFSAVDELLEVDGIGEKTLAEIAPHVTL